jgi:hypothetical protein
MHMHYCWRCESEYEYPDCEHSNEMIEGFNVVCEKRCSKHQGHQHVCPVCKTWQDRPFCDLEKHEDKRNPTDIFCFECCCLEHEAEWIEYDIQWRKDMSRDLATNRMKLTATDGDGTLRKNWSKRAREFEKNRPLYMTPEQYKRRVEEMRKKERTFELDKAKPFIGPDVRVYEWPPDTDPETYTWLKWSNDA